MAFSNDGTICGCCEGEGSIETSEVAIVSRNGDCLMKRMAKESSKSGEVIKS